MKSKQPSAPSRQQTSLRQNSIEAGSIIIGRVAKVDHSGAYVDFPQNTLGTPLLAISTIPIPETCIGREVALLFNGGDLGKPVIMGVIHSEMLDSLDNNDSENDEQWLDQPLDSGKGAMAENSDLEVVADGKAKVIEAQDELTLKCGKSSITLTKEGKIFLRGTYLSSRSTGTNRILGGSVLLN